MTSSARHLAASLDEGYVRSVLVGGQWRDGGGERFAVHDPSDGTVVAHVGNGGLHDACDAVGAAASALPQWSGSSPRARADVLMKIFSSVLAAEDELAELITKENGKSIADARSEVRYAAEFFRWFAEECVRTSGQYGEAPLGGSRTIVTHHPVGVAALVTPWNFPAAMIARKIAPALAAGCTVVVKPARETPLTAVAMMRIAQEAGLPDGAVNLVTTDDSKTVVGAWLKDKDVRKLSFTGSTAVGSHLLRQAADRVLNCSMELGGNAPFIVTADAHIEAAVEGAMIAKFRGSGQACTAANRFYVHADVLDDFTDQLVKAVSSLRVGSSADGSDIGPMISPSAVNDITSLVDASVAAGASVAFQSPVPDGDGFFYPPTVLTSVPADAPVVTDEIFGPVAPIVSWSDVDELMAQVNGTELGLAAYVYAGSMQAGLALGESIEAGMVAVNRGVVSDPSAPFGGMKQSGLGREGARVGMEEFMETQYLSVGWPWK
ncbi:NAD-dependent succinate-semialdehyde dehydrogenase [Gordonia terrae]|uniref:NAD-dependent succinate-semialdehyde dehydrogenase n=1 Tax=Gordonia terrae TaxID=2055 RepID=UPI003F6C69C9